MKRKQQILKAIEILAPGDTFILKAAESVPEESLPVAPGVAALELIVVMQKLTPPPAPLEGSQSSGQNPALG